MSADRFSLGLLVPAKNTEEAARLAALSCLANVHHYRTRPRLAPAR